MVVANQELATVRSAGRLVTALRQRYGKSTVFVVSRYDQHAEIGRADVERVMGSPVSDVFRATIGSLSTRSTEADPSSSTTTASWRTRIRLSPGDWWVPASTN